jgi:hypothetical protein
MLQKGRTGTAKSVGGRNDIIRTNEKNHHPYISKLVAAERSGVVDRREFLALATALDATTAAAYSLIGLTAPTPPSAQTPIARAHRLARQIQAGTIIVSGGSGDEPRRREVSNSPDGT